jgi:leader peptidase (prepilin peptidase) / N-methyltransferase
MISFLWIGLGLVVGSFINVVIHRLPRGRSVVSPRSRCPGCKKMIAWYDNIPVLSFALLRARCRACRTGISWRYPAVELLVAALAWSIQWRWPDRPFWALAAALAAAALVAVAFIDWDTFLIPDRLSLGLLATGLAAAPLNPLFPGTAGSKLLASFLGALAGFLICWGVAAFGEKVFKKEAMGGGDIKLLAAVGAWSGALGAFDCLILASFAGSAYGAGLMLRGRIGRAEPIPFGPFLAAGAVFNFFHILPFGFPFHNL